MAFFALLKVDKKNKLLLNFYLACILAGFVPAVSTSEKSKLPFKDGSSVTSLKPLDIEKKTLDLEKSQLTDAEAEKLKKKKLEVEKSQLKNLPKNIQAKDLQVKDAKLNLQENKIQFTTKKPKPKILNPIRQDDAFEFDLGFLHLAQDQDISKNLKYLTKSDIPPGAYLVATRVNRQEIGNFELFFKLEGESLAPCLNLKLLEALNLEEKLKNNLEYQITKTDSCLTFSKALIKANFDFDAQKMQLDLWIPNTLIAKISKDAFNLKKYSSGDNSMFLKYYINHYATKNLEKTRNYEFNSSSLNYLIGANMGALHIRHSSSLSSVNNSLPKYSYGSTFAHFDVPSWYSQIYFGNVGTGLKYSSNASLLGLSIASDPRMLPYTKQGYAPEIQGFANTNALVTIEQDGIEIYKTNVARGDFTIKDLKPLHSNSDLKIIVHESDGSKNQKIIGYFKKAAVLRKDTYSYNSSFGFFNRGTDILWKEPILAGEFAYGVSNNITLASSLNLSLWRQETALALIYNTQIGSFSLDANFAHSHIQKNHFFGSSFGAAYSNYFNSTKTNITLAAYRYTMKNYFGLSEAIYLNNKKDLKNFKLPNKLKNSFSFYLGQNIPWNLGNLSVNLSLRNYWNKSNFDFFTDFSYSVNIKNLSFRFNYYRTQDLNTKKYFDRLGFSISLPFSNAQVSNGNFSSSLHIFPNTVFNNKSSLEFQHALGINGSFKKTQANYSLMFSNLNNKEMSISASGNFKSKKITTAANFSYNTRNSIQYAFNLNGAIVLHRGGVNLIAELGDTFAIVEAKDAAGARISSHSNFFIDANGYGIIPYLSPYLENSISIDTKGLPFNYEFESTGSTIIPANLSSSIISFDSNKAPAVFLQLSKQNAKGGQEFLPMGSFIFNSKGEEMGFIGMAGRVFLKSEKINDTYSVVWGTEENTNCFFDLNIAAEELESEEIKLYKIICKP